MCQLHDSRGDSEGEEKVAAFREQSVQMCQLVTTQLGFCGHNLLPPLFLCHCALVSDSFSSNPCSDTFKPADAVTQLHICGHQNEYWDEHVNVVPNSMPQSNSLFVCLFAQT